MFAGAGENVLQDRQDVGQEAENLCGNWELGV
jgi:hypothetical protein